MNGTTLTLALVMAVLGGASLVLTLMTLPGNWAILLLAASAQGWAMAVGAPVPYSGWTLAALFAIAVLGEVAETAMGAAGAKAGGGRGRGAWGAVIGSFAGALAGTVLLAFIPLAGTLVGALIGAAIGAFAGELTYGDRRAASLVAPAAGAAVGRFAGILVKLAFGLVMWVIAVAGARVAATLRRRSFCRANSNGETRESAWTSSSSSSKNGARTVGRRVFNAGRASWSSGSFCSGPSERRGASRFSRRCSASPPARLAMREIWRRWTDSSSERSSP